MKITYEKLMGCFAIILTVGVPGLKVVDQFLAADEAGVESFDTQTIIRITLYLSVAIALFFLVIVGKLKINIQILRAAAPFLILYTYYFVTVITLLPFSQQLSAYYRILEWYVFLFLIVAWLSATVFSNFRMFTDAYLKWVLVFPIVIVISCLVPFPELAYNLSHGNVRLGGFLFHPNRFGLISAVCFLYCYLLLENKGIKLISASFCLLLLFATYSRGTIIGLFLILIPILFLRSRRGLRPFFVVLTILVIASLIYFEDNIWLFMSRGQGIENAQSGSGRADIWAGAFDFWSDSLVFGHGFINGAKYQLIKYVSLSAGYRFPAVHAHNDYLQALLNGGFISFGILLFALTSIFRNLIAIRNILTKDEFLFCLAVILQILFAGFTEIVFSGAVVYPASLLIIMNVFFVNLRLNQRKLVNA